MNYQNIYLDYYLKIKKIIFKKDNTKNNKNKKKKILKKKLIWNVRGIKKDIFGIDKKKIYDSKFLKQKKIKKFYSQWKIEEKRRIEEQRRLENSFIYFYKLNNFKKYPYLFRYNYYYNIYLSIVYRFNLNLRKKKTLNKNKFIMFFSKSNVNLSLVSKKLLYTLSIGKYISLIGPNRSLWKKKNNRYKKLIFEFFYKLISLTKFRISLVYVKNIRNTFFLFLKYLKKINYSRILIKDTIHYTKVKKKKKTYIKRRISRKLNYINPLKV